MMAEILDVLSECAEYLDRYADYEDDVERVARAMCWQGGYNPDEIMANDGPRWRYYVPQARAAMVATLELTAEALRGIVSGQDETEGAAQTNIADWLQQRANDVKGCGNGWS